MIAVVVAAACVDPAAFGAIPNDGKSDTEAIQQALERAESVSGEVCLGAGEWDLDRSKAIPSLVIERGPVVIRGVGPTTVLRMKGPGHKGAWRGIQVRGPARDVTIRDLTIDGLGAYDTEEQTHLVEIAMGARDTTIDHVHFGPMRRPDQKVGDGIGGDCVRLIGEDGKDVDGVKLIDSVFADCDRSGIALQRHVRRVVIRGDTITGTGDTPIDFEPTGAGAGGSIQDVAIDHTTIDRPKDAQGEWAISLTGTDLTVDNLVIKNGGINMGNVLRVAITNNDISGLGARLSLFRRAENVTISGNHIAASAEATTLAIIRASHNHGFVPHGITITHNVLRQPKPAPVIELLSATHVTIANNELHYDATDPTWAFVDVEAIADDVDGIRITDNELDVNGLGLRLGPARHAFHDVVFTNNKLVGAKRAIRCEGTPAGFDKPLTLAGNKLGTATIECPASIVPVRR